MQQVVTVSGESTQASGVHSFQGGRPMLPPSAAIPSCGLCDGEQTFYFQIDFPEGHVWCGYVLSLFACTQCAHEDHFIPEMLQAVLPGAEIPAGFLSEYQRNFRILVNPRGQLAIREDYEPRIRYRPWKLIEAAAGGGESILIGGEPSWLMEPEAPASYGGKEMVFLAQLPLGHVFDTLEGVPAQMSIGLTGEPEEEPPGEYQLFIQNQLYFFATREPDGEAVYVLTQLD